MPPSVGSDKHIGHASFYGTERDRGLTSFCRTDRCTGHHLFVGLKSTAATPLSVRLISAEATPPSVGLIWLTKTLIMRHESDLLIHIWMFTPLSCPLYVFRTRPETRIPCPLFDLQIWMKRGSKLSGSLEGTRASYEQSTELLRNEEQKCSLWPWNNYIIACYFHLVPGVYERGLRELYTS